MSWNSCNGNNEAPHVYDVCMYVCLSGVSALGIASAYLFIWIFLFCFMVTDKKVIRKCSAIDIQNVRVQVKDIVCYLSLLEGGRPEDKLECKYARQPQMPRWFMEDSGAARGGEMGEIPPSLIPGAHCPINRTINYYNVSLSAFNESKQFTGSGGQCWVCTGQF